MREFSFGGGMIGQMAQRQPARTGGRAKLIEENGDEIRATGLFIFDT